MWTDVRGEISTYPAGSSQIGEPTTHSHSQEEADTLLVLHALTVLNDTAFVVNYPDTYVLLLLVHMYPNLPTSTIFPTGKGRLKRNISVGNIYKNLGPKRTSVLLGFHALIGTDMSGRFAGRTKDSCFYVL